MNFKKLSAKQNNSSFFTTNRTNQHEQSKSITYVRGVRGLKFANKCFSESFKTLLLLIIFLVNAGFASCSPNKLTVQELPIERNGQVIAVVKAEIAVTNEERRQGLMGRKILNDGNGMFFVFERDEVLSFWMKDTLIPLTIAFIASDGRIIEMKDMQPNDLNPVRSSRSVRYALEVPQGWFSRAGIQPGDTVIFRGL
jgi:uncharacterized membrane protein (UPF0127 family)